jgi:hypothetical protein
MRLITLLTLSLTGVIASAQNDLRLISSDGSLFNVYLSDTAFNRNAEASLLLKNISTDTLNLRVKFKDGPSDTLVFHLLDKKRTCSDKEFEYILSPEKKSVKTKFSGIYERNRLPQPIVPEKPKVDSSQIKKNRRLGTLAELKDGRPEYINNLPLDGVCKSPMPEENKTFINLLMTGADIVEEKIEIAENICLNNCLSVAQLTFVGSFIPYEIDRLKIVRIAFSNLTDKNNAGLLEKCFQFPASIAEVRKLVTDRDAGKIKEGVCKVPSAEDEVKNFRDLLAALDNDQKRTERIRTDFRKYCYTTAQVSSILSAFVHDREKLDAAKLFYFRCTDKENYTKVADTFSYPQSVESLKKYISSVQK